MENSEDHPHSRTSVCARLFSFPSLGRPSREGKSEPAELLLPLSPSLGLPSREGKLSREGKSEPAVLLMQLLPPPLISSRSTPWPDPGVEGKEGTPTSSSSGSLHPRNGGGRAPPPSPPPPPPSSPALSAARDSRLLRRLLLPLRWRNACSLIDRRRRGGVVERVL